MNSNDFASIKFSDQEKEILLKNYSCYIVNDSLYTEERIRKLDPFDEIFGLYLDMEERKVVLYGLVDKFPEEAIFKDILKTFDDLHKKIEKLTGVFD